MRPDKRAKLGLGRTFQIAKPLIGLTALENAMVGAFLHHPKLREAEELARAKLDEVGMRDRAHVRAGELTLSERRRLEVARALALEPHIVLLDEVMAGLNPSEVAELIGLVWRLNESGLTLLIIEHNLKVVRAFSMHGGGPVLDALRTAGFAGVQARTVPAPRRFPSLEDGVRSAREFPTFVALLQLLSEAEREQVWSEVGREWSRFAGAGGLELPGEQVVLSATS